MYYYTTKTEKTPDNNTIKQNTPSENNYQRFKDMLTQIQKQQHKMTRNVKNQQNMPS